jgi:hypothetical protein
VFAGGRVEMGACRTLGEASPRPFSRARGMRGDRQKHCGKHNSTRFQSGHLAAPGNGHGLDLDTGRFHNL